MVRTSEHWKWPLNACNISTNLLQIQMVHLIYQIPFLLHGSMGTAPNSSFYCSISQLLTYNSSKESYSSWILPFFSPASFSIMLASSGYCFTCISTSANSFRNISMTVFVTAICCYEWNEVNELMLTGGRIREQGFKGDWQTWKADEIEKINYMLDIRWRDEERVEKLTLGGS